MLSLTVSGTPSRGPKAVSSEPTFLAGCRCGTGTFAVQRDHSVDFRIDSVETLKHRVQNFDGRKFPVGISRNEIDADLCQS